MPNPNAPLPNGNDGARARAGARFLRRHHVNTLIYFGTSVLSKGASILLIPVYTSRLTRSEYAVYGLCQTLYWAGPPIFTLALSAALARFFFDDRDPERRDQVVGQIALPIICMCLGAALLFEGIAHVAPNLHVGHLTRTHLRLVVWTCAALGMLDIPSIYYRSSESAGRFAMLNLSVFSFTLGSIAYLMLVRNLGLLGLLGGMLTGQLAGAGFALYFTFAKLKPSLDRSTLSAALRYSIPFIPHMVGTSLMSGIDRWTLEYYHLYEDLGLYTLAAQLGVPVQLATSAWNEASSPRFLAAWRDGGDSAARRTLPRIAIGFLLVGFSALIGVLALLPLLRYLVGLRFQAAFLLVPWIGIGLVIGSLFSAFINVLFLRKTTHIIPILTLLGIGVGIGLNAVFVKLLGVYGAILATGLAYTFRSTIMLVFALRELNAGRNVR